MNRDPRPGDLELDLPLLELSEESRTGWWRIAQLWTLLGERQQPLAEFVPRVRERLRAEGLPAALLPADL